MHVHLSLNSVSLHMKLGRLSAKLSLIWIAKILKTSHHQWRNWKSLGQASQFQVKRSCLNDVLIGGPIRQGEGLLALLAELSAVHQEVAAGAEY